MDSEGYFYIDWCIPPEHLQLRKESIQELLAQNTLRLKGQTEGLPNPWRGRLAVVGSGAVLGNDLLDHGATPLLKDTFLASKHWNVANSIITGRFVRRAPLGTELALITLLGVIAAFLTWELRVLTATGLVILAGIAYVALSVLIYSQTRYWLPLVLPLVGSLLMTYGSLLEDRRRALQ